MFVRSGIGLFGLILAAALPLSMLPAAGQTYTPEQQQACTGDAFRVCGDFVPDVDRITACMIRNKSQLSPGCRAFFRPDPEVAPVAAQRPVSLRPVAKRKPVAKGRKGKKPSKR